MSGRDRQAAQDRLLRDLAREIRGLRRDGGIEAVIERRMRRLQAELEASLSESMGRILSGMLGGEGGAGQLLAGLIELPRFSEGGVVDGARLLALGGEAGPEAVLPLTRLADGRLGVRADAAMAPPVAVTINLGDGAAGEDGGGVTAPQAALAAALSAQLDQALDQAVAERIRAQLRDGGLLAADGSLAGAGS